jgi:hypothetical protein
LRALIRGGNLRHLFRLLLGARRERSREPAQSRDDQFTPYQTVIGSKAAADRRDTHRVEGNPDGEAATFGAVRARAPA